MVIGTNFFAGVVVLGYLGHLLDKRLGHEYRYLVAGSSLGIVWALYEAIKLALLLSRDDDVSRNSEGKNGTGQNDT